MTYALPFADSCSSLTLAYNSQFLCVYLYSCLTQHDLHTHTLTRDHYFIYTGWMSNSTPYIVWVDRNQNYSEYCTYPDLQPTCNKVRGEGGGWKGGRVGGRGGEREREREGERALMCCLSRTILADSPNQLQRLDRSGKQIYIGCLLLLLTSFFSPCVLAD